MPRSSMVTTGTSGSGDVLHLRQEVAHRTGVDAVTTATGAPARLLGQLERGPRDHAADVGRSIVPQRLWAHTHAGIGRGDAHRVVVEQLGDVGRDTGQCVLHPLVRLGRAVAQAKDPLGRVVAVVVDLL